MDAMRFFDKDMFARANRGQGVERMKFCGIGNQHDVGGFDDALEGVKADETMIVIHQHLRWPDFLKLVAFAPDAVEKDISHRHEPRAGIRRESLGRRAGVAAAAANHADADDVAACGVGAAAKFDRAD